MDINILHTSDENKRLWDKVLSDVELNVSKANFSTWFKDTNIIKYENGTVYLSVPNEFVRNWLAEKYHKFILKSLRNIKDSVRNIEYIVVNNSTKKKNLAKLQQNSSMQEGELPLSDFYINKEDNLNPKYTFDSFVVGSFNELAHAASQAIIKKQGIVYNPLFIYGNSGYGKTHLIQAAGNHIKGEGKKVFYVTSEKFSMDCVNSIQQNKLNFFKEKYRKYDVLIMDDIQFLSNKERSQEELFHLFNTLYDSNKQIIFSSDKHPSYIPGLADRLKSRFGQGMIVDVQSPDLESRMEILRKKAAQNNFYLPEDTINMIALSVQGNIRELEGILNSIVCQSQLKNRELSISEIKNLLKNSSKPKKNISAEEVVKIISDFYNIDESVIYAKTRKKDVVKPRQVIMFILRTDFNISYPSIGEKLGGRDHTTVIHSCKKIEDDIKTNSLLEQELEQIRSMF